MFWKKILMVFLIVFSLESLSLAGQEEKKEIKSTNIVVMGDSLADGIWMILREKVKGNKEIKLTRYTKVSSGICRIDFYNWVEKTRELFKKQKVDILIIFIGGNDKQSFRLASKTWVHYNQKQDWILAYAKRAMEIKDIIEKNKPYVFWVGLPSMRSKPMNDHALRVNSIYKSLEDEDRFRYISIWDLTTDEKGLYQASRKNEKGVSKGLRSGDGVHFSTFGNALVTDRVYQEVIKIINWKKIEPEILSKIFK
uniref:DUF459 domain-containing protein n=1 Tax=candidate division CPR3 bacterium TaxID=2268181 RepID=A0A7C4M0A1_UNCC3